MTLGSFANLASCEVLPLLFILGANNISKKVRFRYLPYGIITVENKPSNHKIFSI